MLSIQYAPLGATDFSPYILNLQAVDGVSDIEYLFIIWAGDFSYLYTDLTNYGVAADMEIAGACICLLYTSPSPRDRS